MFHTFFTRSHGNGRKMVISPSPPPHRSTCW